MERKPLPEEKVMHQIFGKEVFEASQKKRKEELKERFRRKLHMLTENEREVVTLRYGLEGDYQTVDQVAKAIEKSHEWVSRMEAGGISKLLPPHTVKLMREMQGRHVFVAETQFVPWEMTPENQEKRRVAIEESAALTHFVLDIMDAPDDQGDRIPNPGRMGNWDTHIISGPQKIGKVEFTYPIHCGTSSSHRGFIFEKSQCDRASAADDFVVVSLDVNNGIRYGYDIQLYEIRGEEKIFCHMLVDGRPCDPALGYLFD